VRRAGARSLARVVHISDLHFGRTRADLVAPLVDVIAGLSPDLVAVSGDLTQRALAHQFSEAMEMIRQLAGPVLMVPGNHDIPLYNPLARLFAPFGQWRRWVGPDLAPSVDLPGLLALGMNTADPLAWQRGRVRRTELERICARLSATGPDRLRVVVMHHPLDQPPGSPKEPMQGADHAAQALTAAGADVVLSGHLHAWGAAPFSERAAGRASVFVQAGTGLSTRLRGEENDFNLIEAAGDRLAIIRHRAIPGGTAFVAEARAEFHRGDKGWARSG
jgi:3',5'-cyclic AMP phosphodiesterase CpdA